MLDGVIQELEKRGFIAVKSGFAHLALDDECRVAVTAQQQTSQVAALLASYPDVFVYPRKSDPATHCFFIVVGDADGSLSADRGGTLNCYFPQNRIAVLSHRNGIVFATWLTDGQPEPLNAFLNRFQ